MSDHNESWHQNAPRLEDWEVVLQVCNCIDVPDKNPKSLREIGSRLEIAASSLLNHVRKVTDYLAARSGPNIAHTVSLFQQDSSRQALQLTDVGRLVKKRTEMLREFMFDFREAARVTSGHRLISRQVTIGGPQTIVHRLLAKAFSAPEKIHHEPVSTGWPNLNLVVGNTDQDLIPKLRAGLLDFVVGYGAQKVCEVDGSDVIDADILDAIKFKSLNFEAEMVLLCHPSCQIQLKRGEPVWASELTQDKAITPEAIDFRSTPLIAVPSWRQPLRLQSLIEEARRLNCLREVSQFDDALALVRANCGVAITTKPFSDRRGVRHFSLGESNDRGDFSRPVGIYYRLSEGLSPDACRYAEFLRAYIEAYLEQLPQFSPGYGDKDFPTEIDFRRHQKWAEVSAGSFPSRNTVESIPLGNETSAIEYSI